MSANILLKGKMPVNAADDDADDDPTTLAIRVAIMLLVFFVSLFSASFPTLTRRARSPSIPPIVFFIGKHFGTGVILSTAFVHLLQDAFDSLRDPRVVARTQVGRWTGLIVLGSLLLIFVVEYISTAYVDRLHSYDSAPPSPRAKPTAAPEHDPPHSADGLPDECSPLLPPPAPPHAPTFFAGHHRYESRSEHAEHARASHPRLSSFAPAAPPLCTSHHHHHHHHHRDGAHTPDDGDEDAYGHAHHHHHHPHEREAVIGRKRQIVGILVLQLGIMLHSAVIGLTLSIASGADFASLATAIAFHQLFEGLSLGVRIAALPPDAPPALRAALVGLFAITTPAGIVAGLVALRGVDAVSLLLTQGLLSSISAGMLIYAGTAEMLAADFVLDPSLSRAPIRRQALALGAVALGAAGMAAVGM
ncbi:Zinc/iron permease [Vararia minispora EC-137]|uniref:Zinc/iron permease n=1 Tax=Vararia minispora EC-137 TaxID=1314806 RepID=A0ACB8Q9A8_9AGAM|nr:Zinc/iron permease [Vararia minispora EC-137]